MKLKPEKTKFLKFLADTWPPKKIIKFGSWTIRIGDGAGKRASAISLDGNWEDSSFKELKKLLQNLSKSEIFMVYQSDSIIEKKLEIPAYEKCIKASHYFNLLDARGVLSVSERASYIKRVREISKSCCELYIKKQENN